MSTKIVTITVLELIAKLGKFPLEAPVILACDEQGSLLMGLDTLELDDSGSVILWPAPSSAKPVSSGT